MRPTRIGVAHTYTPRQNGDEAPRRTHFSLPITGHYAGRLYTAREARFRLSGETFDRRSNLGGGSGGGSGSGGGGGGGNVLFRRYATRPVRNSSIVFCNSRKVTFQRRLMTLR